MLPSTLEIGYDNESAAGMQTGGLENVFEDVLTFVGTMLADASGGAVLTPMASQGVSTDLGTTRTRSIARRSAPG